MSQQYPGQPGGFGGQPPGYGGPPAGAPPGGGGYPPPGGYGPPPGPPPGGYAPPPGGYAPPPGFGAPPAPMGPVPMAPAKSGAMMWVGIGCGIFVLLALVGVGVAIWWFQRVSREAVHDFGQQLASASAAVSQLSAPPSSAAGSPAGAGAECTKARSCCLAIVEKTAAGAQAATACEAFQNPALPTLACTQALEGYRKVAQPLGVSCD